MRHQTLMLAALAAFCGVAMATDSAPAGKPPGPGGALTGADCLDPAAARSWHYVSGDELLVDAGRRKYRITFREMCTELGIDNTLHFRGDAISGRVCGNFGDAVRVRGRTCRIDRVELLDKQAYGAATGGRQGSVSASTQRR